MFSQVDVFVGGIDGYNTYRIPAMVVTDRGTVLAFCEGRKNDAQDDGEIDLLLKRSEDGGATWSKQMVLHKEGELITIGNPCPIFDPRDNTVHLLFTRNNKRLFYMKSIDDGLTWTEPVEHTEILKAVDYPLVRIATGPVHGIVLKTGRLVAPIWVSDRERRADRSTMTKAGFQSGVIYSDDQGVTWQASELVPPDLHLLNECTVLEREDGTLLLNMRVHRMGVRAISESTDGGETWSRPVEEASLPCPICQASIIRLARKETLFSNPGNFPADAKTAGKRRQNLTIRLSEDDAKTWPHSRILNPGPSGYSDLAVMKDGSILCLYECGEKVYNEKISIARFTRSWITETE